MDAMGTWIAIIELVLGAGFIFWLVSQLNEAKRNIESLSDRVNELEQAMYANKK